MFRINLFRAFTTGVSLAAFLAASPAFAYTPGTLYVDTAGNGGVNTDSGTTDTASSVLAACQTVTAFDITKGCTGTGAGTGVASITTTAVTLNGQPNLTSLPVNGSQAIFLTGATNTNQKIFWITNIGTCDGTESAGTCVVTVSVAPTGVSANATWVIGGRITLPNTTIESAIRPGDTIKVNNSIGCGAATVCLTLRIAGDNALGKINLIGKAGSQPTLSNTGNANILSVSGSPLNWVVSNLFFSNVGTSITMNLSNAAQMTYDHVKVTGSGATSACFFIGIQSLLKDSEITGCNTGGLNTTANLTLYNNYIHDMVGSAGDCVVLTAAFPASTFTNNIFSKCKGFGINLSGATSSFANMTVVEGNTFYANGGGNLNVSNVFTRVLARGNIFVNVTGQKNIVYPSVSPLTDTMVIGGTHTYNVFWDVDAGGAGALTNVVADATDSVLNPNLNAPNSGDFNPQTAAVAATASWALNAATITVASCTGVASGMGIWDKNLAGNTFIGNVSTCASTTLTPIAGAAHASSGSADALSFGTPIVGGPSPIPVVGGSTNVNWPTPGALALSQFLAGSGGGATYYPGMVGGN